MEAKENTSEQGKNISRQDSNESNSTEGSDNKVGHLEDVFCKICHFF